MKGYYLYCIRPRTKTPNESKFHTGRTSLVRSMGKTENEKSLGRGVDKKGRVYLVPWNDLEAVVSEVALNDFASEEIQKRALEDLKWIKEKAELHEKVIEKAMGKKKKTLVIPVIPMKFGTIFKSVEKLNSILQKNYSKFKDTLERLKGKQEWSVKIYLKNPEALREEIKNQSIEARAIQDSLSSLSEGLAYFKEKEVQELIDSRFKELLDSYRELFFSHLKKYAASSNRGKILQGEITGKPHPMILNAVFLVHNSFLDDFKTRIDQLSHEAGPKGFYFEYSGPWPPYNFV